MRMRVFFVPRPCSSLMSNSSASLEPWFRFRTPTIRTVRHKLQRALGKPESAEDYEIDSPHEWITPDPAVNARLHEAGLSSEQAQLVYNLAAEHLVPVIEEANSKASQEHERQQLTAHFGGEQKWQTVAPQIKTWGSGQSGRRSL